MDGHWIRKGDEFFCLETGVRITYSMRGDRYFFRLVTPGCDQFALFSTEELDAKERKEILEKIERFLAAKSSREFGKGVKK